MASLRSVLALILSFSFGSTIAQEFQVHNNGLIYSDATMSSLKHIVDSMNIKYRKCDVWKEYNTVQQALCHYISVKGPKVKQAVADIKANMPYDSFVKKYSLENKEENLLAIKEYYADYKEVGHAHFVTMQLGKTHSVSIYSEDTSLLHKKLSGAWAFEHNERSEYRNEDYLEALYFKEGFKSLPVPERYAKMIQYSDCMIDTNAMVYIGNTTSRREQTDTKGKDIAAFVDYAEKKTAQPDPYGYKDDYKKYSEVLDKWESDLDSTVKSISSTNPEYRKKLNRALEEAYTKKISTYYLEYYATPLVAKDTLLFLKRCRTVIGGCSQDQAPRYHALEIAKLSAESVNWEIFLRSHLDVMNDNFERASDGSYAQAERQTYIGELEALDIDVTTLLLGISLRIDNPAGNHYFGSIGRIGRAMTESVHKEQIEEQMGSIIKDRNLDDYNRILIYYLYKNYLYHLTDEAVRTKSTEKLKGAIATLPAHYSERISFKEVKEE